MPFSLIPGSVDVACGPQHVALTPGIPPDDSMPCFICSGVSMSWPEFK